MKKYIDDVYEQNSDDDSDDVRADMEEGSNFEQDIDESPFDCEEDEDEDGSSPTQNIEDKRAPRRSSGRQPAKKRPKIARDFLQGGYLSRVANGVRAGGGDKRLVRLRLLVRREVTYTQLRVAMLLLEICSFKKWTKVSAEKVAHELYIAQSHASKALKDIVAHGLVSRREEEQAYSYKLNAPKYIARKRVP